MAAKNPLGFSKVDKSVFKDAPQDRATQKPKEPKKSAVFATRPLREPYKRPTMAELPDGWQDRFLAELSIKPIVSRAARIAGVSRRTVYAYREDDTEFDKAWEDAVEEGKDRHDELLAEQAERGNPAAAIFLAKVWRYGGADIALPGKKDKTISVGWAE